MMQMLFIPYASTALVTDPTWIFSIVLCIILFAPLLLRSLRIPHVIGLILAGVLIGKYGLNILDRDSSFELFGQVGIYYIMFLAGLELDMGSVQHHGRDGLKFGVLTFLIPFLLGLITSHYLLGFGTLTSVLMACIYSSHTLVTYPTVGRYGLGRHRVVVKSVVATAFALFVSLLVLAFVVGSLKPDTSLLTWLIFAAKCFIYVAAVLYVIPHFGRWFLRRYDDSVMQYIFVLALVFLSASFAKLVGLEGLLGAFLAGLVVNRLIPKTSPLMSRLEFVGNAIFIPYFLIGVGMLIDVRIMLGDPQTLWIILVMVVTGAITKLVAAAAMAWWSGEDRSAMWLMFGLTNAHAAGALAIVMIGTDPAVHLMNNQVLNGTVMLILFSCVISGFATSRGAKRLALSDTSLEDNRGSYHGKCLVAYSQYDNVDVMTQFAILIRNPYIPDSLMGLCVSYDAQNEEEGADSYRLGKQMLELAQGIAASADVPMATLNRISTNIAGGILRTMKENECGEVVMCLSDRTTGMNKSSLGQVIDSVVSGSHREVMIVRSIVPPGTIRRVLVAVPQKAEYEVGFYKWLEHICRIGEQLDCHLEFYAHTDTLPYIKGYMKQKHENVRSQYAEMNLWTQLLNLQHETDANSMLVAVTARPGFISYQPQFDNLPLQIHRYFSHTSVMLLYPDQWGDPLETVSVFTPNGMAVTRQQRSLGGLLRRIFFPQKTLLLMLASFFALPFMAQKPDFRKMSSYVRRAALQQTAQRRAAPTHLHQSPLMCAIVSASSQGVLEKYSCKIQAQWGNLYIVTLRTDRLAALSREPQIQRIEAGEPCSANMDTSRLVTHTDALHGGRLGNTPWTGRGVVMGIMDIGFDLTHPTFFSADGSEYRIRSFWDQIDYSGKGDNTDSMYIGCEYTTERTILRKAYAADGLQQFHGTHTAGTAAGSGYNSSYVGAAPEADICLVANAVSSDVNLIPDSLLDLYNTASDLLGFKYIFDYADRHNQPCVISFSEGRKQELYGEDLLAFQILDSLLTPGHILCSSAGNDGINLTYLHKPEGKASASSLMKLNKTSKQAFYNLRGSTNSPYRFQLHFYATPNSKKGVMEYSTEQIYAQPDSMLIDTVSVGVKQYMIFLASYPSCFDEERIATELYVKDVSAPGGPDYRIGLTLLGEEVETEAFTYSGFFENTSTYPEFCDAERSHSINFPSCSPNIICVGSTAYRTGVNNYNGDWVSINYGSDGMRGTNTSVGPSLAGLTKPDVMAPGQNIIASFSSYYAEANPNADQREWDVERFQFKGREYSWSAQSGTSMASPIVGGIIACWMQAFPRLSYQDAMEAIAATSRQPDSDLSYPNNYYGYGEIDAEAGLQYLFNKYGIEDGIQNEELRVKSEESDNAVYDLSGRKVNSQFSIFNSQLPKGIYIVNGKKVIKR